MFKKVIALSTAAMILLTPMSKRRELGRSCQWFDDEGLVHGWQDDRHKGWGYLYLYGRRA